MVNSGSKPRCYCFILLHLCSTYLSTCTLLGWSDWRGKMNWIHSSGRTGWRTCPGNSLGRSGTPYPVSATGAAASALEKEIMRRPSTGMIRKLLSIPTFPSAFLEHNPPLASHQQILHICIQWRTRQNHSCWELKPAVTVPYQQVYFKTAVWKGGAVLKSASSLYSSQYGNLRHLKSLTVT